jgi:hypothetical protein
MMPPQQVGYSHACPSWLAATLVSPLGVLASSLARMNRRDHVTWPSGLQQKSSALEARKWYRFQEGSEHAVLVTPEKPAR